MNNIKQAVMATAIAATSFSTGAIGNVKPAQAQSYDASGQWQCVTANKDITNNKYNGSFTDEMIVYAYPNGTFEAQGITTMVAGNNPYIAQGQWQANQTPQGTDLGFVGLRQDQWGGQSSINVGGILQNENYLHNQLASNINQVTMACQRIG